MALSENEQRILRQIEEELQNDSKFAQAVSLHCSIRSIRWHARIAGRH